MPPLFPGMPDIEQITRDLDSRLEQIANQGRVTNGLLALIVLNQLQPIDQPGKVSEQERLACIALARMAFNDPSSILNAVPETPNVPQRDHDDTAHPR